MTTFTIYHNVNDQGLQALGVNAVIHKAGCRDIARDVGGSLRYHREQGFVWDVSGSLRDAMDSAIDAEEREMGWGDDDIAVKPCARTLEAVRARAEAARS